MITKFISLPVFLVSLAIGVLFVYLSNPPPTVVYVYPTPDNVGNFEYKDKADNCFQYSSVEVKCPAGNKGVKTIPIQN
jgi:hypothetical protein